MVRQLPWGNEMLNNIRLAFRSLRQNAGLSLVVIAMLALGIGATTALFSLFYQILMKPLPVPEAQRLVNLVAPGPKQGSMDCDTVADCDSQFSYPMFRDLEKQDIGFSGIAAHRKFDVNLAFGEQTSAGNGMLVSGSYFYVLDLNPALGRLIGPQDEPGLSESGVVVLSYDYWQNRFGGDRNVINRTLRVNGQPLTIIGVAPAGFAGTTIGVRPQIFVPLTLAWRVRPTAPRNYEDRRAYWLYVFARLKRNITAEQASTSINSVFRAIHKDVEAPLNRIMSRDMMQQFLNERIILQPGARGQSAIPQVTGQPLTLLFALTGLVLLIVCVNIASLLLVRGASRAGEMAIRASVGASRGQLVWQLLTESIVLAVIGGAAGLVVAADTLDIIAPILPADSIGNISIRLSTASIGFAAGASLFTVVLFGVLPAIMATRISLIRAIKGQTAQSLDGFGMSRLRSALAIGQIAFSTVLLVLAGLFSKSLMNVARVNLGIKVDSVVAFSVSPRLNGYNAVQTTAVFDRIEEELAAQPGVTGVTSAKVALITEDSSGNSVDIEGFENGPSVDTTILRNEVSSSFFDVLSITLLAGRNFTDSDRPGAPKVAIVNQSFVRKFNLGANAIGKHFSGYPYDNVRKVELEIVGVDAAYSRVKDGTPPQYFQPRRQSEDPDSLTYYVRIGSAPDAVVHAIPSLVSRIDPNLPLHSLITMRQQVQDNIYLDRVLAMLSAGFAGLATLLAGIGLYGMLAYNVARRTREFGLRSALGAEPKSMRAMVLRQVGWMALIGGVAGLVAAVALGRAAQALLFGLSGQDPWVLVAALTLLSVVVLAASYMPARRASKIPPMEALRYE